jgi:hypothetical protein
LAFAAGWAFYPNDRSPKGSYYRVISAVNAGEPEAIFPYIETAAQHAAFSIGKYKHQARERVETAYPEPERSRELGRLGELAGVDPGPPVFAWYAQRHGWLDRLRRDLSGVKSVEINGERATVETTRGTRYPFRRRDNGIWGLTLFTARLVSDSEKAARDFAQIEAAAADYEAVRIRQ